MIASLRWSGRMSGELSRSAMVAAGGIVGYRGQWHKQVWGRGQRGRHSWFHFSFLVEGSGMASMQQSRRRAQLAPLLKRDHTLYGGVLHGLDGQFIELQARAVEVLSAPVNWHSAVSITGMARDTIYEALDRIGGAFSKLGIPEPEVEIVVNLAPADVTKEGTWLDLPLAIIMLQAAGTLPDLPEARESDFVLIGEISLHGEIRRIPGVLSLAYNLNP